METSTMPEVSANSSRIITNSAFQFVWIRLSMSERLAVYNFAKKLLQEKQMTVMLSRLLPLGLTLQEAQNVEQNIRNNQPVTFSNTWSKEAKKQITNLILLWKSGALR